MTTSEKYSKELTEVAEKIALEEFDQTAAKHEFSPGYQKRKSDFLKSVEGAAKKQKSKRLKKRLAVAASLLIGIPTTAFAGKKLYDIIAEKNNYEVNVSVKGQGDPAKKGKYYQLKLGYLPEGMTDSQKSNKYSYADNQFKGGFSFRLWRVANQADFSSLSVEESEEVTFGKNKGVVTSAVDSGRENMFDRKVYLVFEEEGYVLEVYVGNDVPETDLKQVFANVELVETTKEQATDFSDYDDYQAEMKNEPAASDHKIVGLAKDSPQLFQIGDVVKPEIIASGDGEPEKRKLNYTVKKVEVRETVAGLERGNLNSDSWQQLIDNRMADESGKLLPYERVTYSQGDGKTTVNEVVAKKRVQPKFVYVTILLENKSDKALEELYLQDGVTLLKEEKNSWNYLSGDQFDEPSSYSMEVDYLSSHGEGKSFYRTPTIQPHEKREIQLGYFVDEDQLDQMFINVFANGHSGEVEELGASDRWWIDIRQSK